ncbi:hypothetical protein PR002_g1853 [Phytophthora rubi]|uniref:Uncharacterized protein n=1 Tax=Phytophthora rubi TaxID=129364 RepID=A0A6A3NNK1_9STRA|nr:hypothetical protein PR002_g1853 [Phytophthora rubi]
MPIDPSSKEQLSRFERNAAGGARGRNNGDGIRYEKKRYPASCSSFGCRSGIYVYKGSATQMIMYSGVEADDVLRQTQVSVNDANASLDKSGRDVVETGPTFADM